MNYEGLFYFSIFLSPIILIGISANYRCELYHDKDMPYDKRRLFTYDIFFIDFFITMIIFFAYNIFKKMFVKEDHYFDLIKYK